MKLSTFLYHSLTWTCAFALASCDKAPEPQTTESPTQTASDVAVDTSTLSTGFCDAPENSNAAQCQTQTALQNFDAVAYARQFQSTYVAETTPIKVDLNHPEEVLPRVKFSQANALFNINYDLYTPVFVALANILQNANDAFYYANTTDANLNAQYNAARQESVNIFTYYYGFKLPAQELQNFNFKGLSVNGFEYPFVYLMRESNNLVYKIIELDSNMTREEGSANFDSQTLHDVERIKRNQEKIDVKLVQMLQLTAAQFYMIKAYNEQLATSAPEKLKALQQDGFKIDYQKLTFKDYIATLRDWVQKGHLEINPQDPLFNRVNLTTLQQTCPQCQFLTSAFDYQFAFNRAGALINLFYELTKSPAWSAIEPSSHNLGNFMQKYLSLYYSDHEDLGVDPNEPLFIDQVSPEDNNNFLSWLNTENDRSVVNEELQKNANVPDYDKHVAQLRKIIEEYNYYYRAAQPNAGRLIILPIPGQSYRYDYSFLAMYP